MKIKLFYFAKVREIVGIDQEEIDVESDIKTLAELIAFLKLRGNQWQAIFDMSSSYRMAINQELAEASHKINANDEVAFFPPIKGG
ncbi:MAG: molybdopterin converting factor subunit 1 [Candidatus Methylopumilus sp.]